MDLKDLTQEQLTELMNTGKGILESRAKVLSGGTVAVEDLPAPEGLKTASQIEAIDKDEALIRDNERVVRANSKIKEDELKTFSIARAANFVLTGNRKGQELEADWIKSRDAFAPSTDKSLQELGTDIAGGFLVPSVVVNDLIEMLKAQTIVRRSGARILENSPKTISVPKKTGNSTAYWVGDTLSSDITDSSVTFGDLSLTLRNLAAAVPITRNLIKYAMQSVEGIVREDIVEQMALSEDLAFMQGTGGLQPLGLRNWPSVQATAAVGNPTFDDLLDCLTTLRGRNVQISPTMTSWWMHPNVLGYLQKHKTGVGQYDYVIDLTQAPPDRILGLPVYTSSQIPTDLGTGADTYAICGNGGTYAIAQGGGIEILVDPYTLSKQLKIQLIAVFEVDGGPRRVEEFQVLNGITT